jgi:hypothetical protein
LSGKQELFHLLVEAGPDKGRRFSIPPGGARLGRSSGNDIVLTDPSLSRFHCRIFFKSDGSLWINDLGSTNSSLINGKPAQDRPLRTGDLLEIGETKMEILHDRPEGAPPAPAHAPTLTSVDLGLSRKEPEAPPRNEPAGSSGSKPSLVLIVAALAVIAVAAVYLLKPGKPTRPGTPRAPTVAPGPAIPQPDAFDLLYEKEEGSSSNLFRYVLTLRDNTLAVQIDDVVSGRHVPVREKKLAPEVVQGFSADLNKLEFFDLREEYSGVPPEGVWSLRDLTLMIGRRTHRVRVLNRLEPDEFKPVREAVESFAQNELGLASLSLPPERLVELARDAVQLGHKYLDERDVKPDNLFNAIRTFESCRWYLETVEPKPDFFKDATDSAEQARKDLDKDYNAFMFEAQKAWSLSDWARCAEQYRKIVALIPDRSDDRHQNARKKLLDVERRLGR